MTIVPRARGLGKVLKARLAVGRRLVALVVVGILDLVVAGVLSLAVIGGDVLPLAVNGSDVLPLVVADGMPDAIRRTFSGGW